MRDLAERLKAQNNGTSWRDCEYAGLRHRFGPTETLSSGTTVRSCRRCPVSIMSVRPRFEDPFEGSHEEEDHRGWREDEDDEHDPALD